MIQILSLHMQSKSDMLPIIITMIIITIISITLVLISRRLHKENDCVIHFSIPLVSLQRKQCVTAITQ
jgi:hypothetical protein